MLIKADMYAAGSDIETLPWEELWSNPDPSKSFDAQSIYTSVQDIRASFKYLKCVCRYTIEGPQANYYFEVIVNVLDQYTNNIQFNILGDVRYYRELVIDYTTGKIDVGVCAFSGGAVNHVLIPYKIYGLRR